MNWISVKDPLPEDGRYVLVHLMKDNWHPRKDSDGVYYKVATIELGISLEDREKMKRGEIEDPDYFFDSGKSKRSRVYGSGDEHANNLRPYCWKEFGPGSYFGQEVDFWCEIDRNLP